jgi:hypothetical protein
MNEQKKEYNAPEAKIAGKANEVVLGWPGGGIDVMNEFLVGNSEFSSDDE